MRDERARACVWGGIARAPSKRQWPRRMERTLSEIVTALEGELNEVLRVGTNLLRARDSESEAEQVIHRQGEARRVAPMRCARVIRFLLRTQHSLLIVVIVFQHLPNIY